MAHLLWTQRQDIGPSARFKFALAYDPVRKLTYLFGGGPASDDTWAWDGRYWTQVSRFGPEKRLGHSMTFDTARGHIVLFGGEPSAGRTVQDTWVYDGVDWTQVEDLGPSPRSEHAAAYDATRRRLVLFGGSRTGEGSGAELVGDTWEWDGISWTQMDEAGPAPRRGHSMAYDSVRKKAVMFGGLVRAEGGAVISDDTWEWDGSTWTQVADTGPSVRAHSAMTSTGGIVVLHGGAGGTTLGDTWQWTSGAWSKLQEFGPSPRRAHSMTYNTDRKVIVLFGGDTSGSRFGDTWEAPKL